jgi:diguanylate cyclase (GGDEF)-like protein
MLVGALLSLGAPAGLLIVHGLQAEPPSWAALWDHFRSEAYTYGYVLVSTMVAFALFGHILGRIADHLADVSGRDPLTGLANTRYLRERLHAEILRARRYHEPLTLVLLDLDDLKGVNDRYGHLAGDETLLTVSRAIRRGLRAADCGARWGGDEFAVLAPNTGLSSAVQLGERLRHLVSEESQQRGRPVTTSVGAATVDFGRGEDVDAATLMQKADAALYRAKAEGRNRVVLESRAM